MRSPHLRGRLSIFQYYQHCHELHRMNPVGPCLNSQDYIPPGSRVAISNKYQESRTQSR